VDGASPEPRATKHLFLRLDILKDDIVSWFHGASELWSANCVAITQSWIDRLAPLYSSDLVEFIRRFCRELPLLTLFSRGLQARGITRDLSWGVPSTLCAYPTFGER
jgi:methionyl-tRNA synthetase